MHAPSTIHDENNVSLPRFLHAMTMVNLHGFRFLTIYKPYVHTNSRRNSNMDKRISLGSI